MKHSDCKESLCYIQLKKSTAKFYEDSFFEMIFKDVLHPGGLDLTERLANLADINENSTVLDIASGKGASAIFLAKKFNCNVIGIDLSEALVRKATELSKTKGVADQVFFKVSDAERLPFKTDSFDAIISECSLCLFPNKKTALKEMYRVLNDEGKLALSDVTLEETDGQFRNKLFFFSCIEGAVPLEVLDSYFTDAGFLDIDAIDSSEVVIDLYKSVKRRSAYLRPILKLFEESEGDVNVRNLIEFARTAEQLIRERKLGYGIVIGKKTK
ncbi:MAG: class I SAM-dependent methyltransferase [Promethearchaeota archaeon]